MHSTRSARHLPGESVTQGQIVFDKRAFRIRLAELGIRSVTEFARRAQLSASTVLQCTLGLVPSGDYREKFASALGCSPGELWKEIPLRAFEGGQ